MYIRSITSITMETKLAVMIGDDVRIPQAPPTSEAVSEAL